MTYARTAPIAPLKKKKKKYIPHHQIRKQKLNFSRRHTAAGDGEKNVLTYRSKKNSFLGGDDRRCDFKSRTYNNNAP